MCNAVLSLYALEDSRPLGAAAAAGHGLPQPAGRGPLGGVAPAPILEDDDAFLYGGGGGGTATAAAAAADAAAPPAGSKRSRVDAFGAEGAAAERAAADDERPPPRPLRLFPADVLVSAAPATDAVLGLHGSFLDEEGAGLAPTTGPHAELALACGLDHTGGLGLASSGLPAVQSGARPLRVPGVVEGLWHLPLPQPDERVGGFVLLGSPGATRPLAVDAASGALADPPPVPAEAEEEAGFLRAARTLAAGVLLQRGTWLPALAAEGAEREGGPTLWRQHDGSNARLIQVCARVHARAYAYLRVELKTMPHPP